MCKCYHFKIIVLASKVKKQKKQKENKMQYYFAGTGV